MVKGANYNLSVEPFYGDIVSSHGAIEDWSEEHDVEILSNIVVDTSYQIHRGIGPDLLEAIYEAIIARALNRRGLRVERQKPLALEYDGTMFDDGLRVDILVNNRLVVELKSVEKLAPVHPKQLLTYLRLLKLPLGLLINFGAPTFKDGCVRIVNRHENTLNSQLRVNRGSRET